MAESCAAPVAKLPDSGRGLDVNFIDIEPSRCSPPIDGFALSIKDAEELVKGVKKIERESKVAEILCTRDKDLLRAENASDKSWALVGKLGTVGVSVAAIITAFVVIFKATGGSQ